jgi:site-specific recombinase XerD
MQDFEVHPSDDKLCALRDALVGFWAAQTWALACCPLQGPGAKGRWGEIKFTHPSEVVRIELQYACWLKFESGQWKPDQEHSRRINRFIRFLTLKYPRIRSLLSVKFSELEIAFRTHLTNAGQKGRYEKKHFQLDRNQQPRYYKRVSPDVSVFRCIYRVIEDAYDERDEPEKDVWDVRRLGVTLNLSTSQFKLNFTHISQQWLREATKKFVWRALMADSFSVALNYLTSINTFSAFLAKNYPLVEPALFDRELIEEYYASLLRRKLSAKTRYDRIRNLKAFFELAAREGWADLPERPLVRREDFPALPEPQPRFIPDYVLDQLKENLGDLPADVRALTEILMECGMRISEGCTCPTDCLTQDSEGDYFLRYYMSKLRKEHSVPISRDTAAVILGQQQRVREKWGADAKYLFPNAKGGPMKQKHFTTVLNQLAYKKKICDSLGRLYRFESHQFRHTVGTTMINNGVPHRFVQLFLGHKSPEMTNRYAKIHDQTLKEEFEKYRARIGPMVNIEGRVVEPPEGAGEVDNNDLQWFKKNVNAQALPNGSCGVPAGQQCPHANACFTCIHFRTDSRYLQAHRDQLARTERIIEQARANGWTRQLEMNLRVKANLQKIIAAISPKEDEDDAA